MSIEQVGRLKGSFKGFRNRDTVFEFHGGGKWQQSEYRYCYHYAYMPNATVVQEGGRYKLHVQGMSQSVEVKRIRA